MSTKRRPVSAKRAAAIAAAAELLAGRRFARRLYGTIAILAVLAGGLTVANLSKLPHPNSTPALARSTTPASFALYTLQRDTGKDNSGLKKPDTILGTSLSGSDQGTVIVSAPRIQEYAALPSALAVVTLNDDNTSSLEMVPLTGGPPTLVPLPSLGTVANLHAAGSKNLIGFTFTASSGTGQYWKTLFVYDVDKPSAAPRAVQGIHGPVTATDWRFVPGAATLVAQTDDQSMFLIDPLDSGKVSPLGTHAGILGFPGSNELAVADPGLKKGVDPPRYSTLNLTTGTSTPLTLPGAFVPDAANGVTTTASQPTVLDTSGQYLQVVRKYDGGKEASVVNLTDKNGPRQLYQPDAAWSRILDTCTSPAGDYLAVETAAPQYTGDQYPVRPEPTPIRTDLVDLKSGTILKSVPGFLPSWCG
ncbi:hypothetical protein [Arthrobacter sp. AZCC_0090]|uniref:hypothetical protein n=1 Tax=Arthrobacter sp. AZCC_0090 TaxID=2735881 RepID=UPI00161FD95A|nr:hypothetical protein [Arthrobacter sp. AZCC_0090]MBB6403433.1 hypothetical protein [Arthrobacter sp. AZCC_0090]